MLLPDVSEEIKRLIYKSDWTCINDGHFQGSVLGPLMFVVCINYFINSIASNISECNDDTKVGELIKLDNSTIVLPGKLKDLHKRSGK